MKVACLIYFFGKRYQEIGKLALKSFKEHNPGVDLYHVNEENGHLYDAVKYLKSVGHGALKYMLAAEIMKKKAYDKIIILGADTITCARLDEFLNDNKNDILATLDYPYQLFSGPLQLSPDSETHLNADVVCFNNIKPIISIIKNVKRFPIYAEQGALNYVVWSGKYDYSVNVVDGPYTESSVVYNARAKGNICAKAGEKPWGPYTNKFYVDDSRLFTGDGKQIKVWHYCEGFGAIDENQFIDLMNKWIFEWFNKETKEFFKKNCSSGNFFEREFSLN